MRTLSALRFWPLALRHSAHQPPLTSRGSITCSAPIARRTNCRRSENHRADFSPFFEHEDGPETPRPPALIRRKNGVKKVGDFEAVPLSKTLLDQHIKATDFALYLTPFSCQTNLSFRLIFSPDSRVSLMA